MRNKWWIVLTVLIIGVFALAACGGGSEPEATPTTAPAAAAPTDTPAAAEAAPTDTPAAAAEAAPTDTPAAETGRADSGCAKDAPTLTIWADDQRATTMISLKDKVAAETGICLDVQEVAFGDIRSKVSLAAPAGEGPDIFVGAHDWLGELSANGVVAEIDLGSKKDQFFPVALEGFTYEGKQLGMPYAVENVALLYNKDLLDAPPATLSEIMTISLQMKEAGTVKQAFALMNGDPYHQEPLNTAWGGYIFGQTEAGYDACDVGLDSEGSINYLKWIDSMVKQGLLSPDVDWETAHVLFETGDAAFMITGPWALERIRNNNINYGIANLPAEVQAGSPFLGVQGFMINAFSPDKILAQTFLVDYVATDAVMDELYATGNRPSAWIPSRAKMDADSMAFATASEAGHPMPAIPAMNAVWDSWDAAIKTVFLQSATPEAAAASAAEQVRKAAGCQ